MIRYAVALALVVGAILWVYGVGTDDARALGSTALALGFTLVAASLTGELLRRLRLPRVTGYLAFGLLVGPYLGNLITEPMARQLQAINGLATTLIAFIAGLTINLDRLRTRLVAITRMTAAILAVTVSGLFVLSWIVLTWWAPVQNVSEWSRLAMAAVSAIAIASFSPTVTAAVIADTGARGRISELVLAVVVLADLVLLALFSLAMQGARLTLAPEAGAGETTLLVRLAWEIGGALAFGALVGALFAMYLRHVGRELTLALLGMCAVLSQVGVTQGFEPLLAAVAAGLIVENTTVAEGDALKAAVQRGSLPVLVVFFVSVGTSLRLEALAMFGAIAVAVSLVRLALVRAGVAAGIALSGINPSVGRYAWTGLVSQAGITLGLTSVVATEFPAWGSQLQLLLVGLIAIHEVVGPILFRNALARAGELEHRAARPLIVVSNREPYKHSYRPDGEIVCSPTTGGVAVALDALMRERGGVWIAAGEGDADRAVVDEHDKLRVPPDAPAYDLRRLWFDDAEYAAYYGGFANEGLWPLCHVVHVRPTFRTSDWEAYQRVNERFAEAIHQELQSPDDPVFIQDYHLALVASKLRQRRPAARTALFWHIPWPYPDRLRICPWRRELLEGLLANDLLAFQLERDRRNFLLAVEEELDAEFEAGGLSVRLDGRPTSVVSVPIGVDFDRIQALAADPAVAAEQRTLAERFCLKAPIIGVGVDRLDYTKGIPERLAALDRLFTLRPDLRGRLTFVQIGVPSRSELESYGAIERAIDRSVEILNARHGVPGQPPPVHYHKGALKLPSLVALYRMAHFCIVSSLHDGMNLVAKEFVASRDDEDGVLVLSELAGAAQELREAIVINPYDIEGFSRGLIEAIDMPREERRRRMQVMRRVVAGRNVFLWASDILEGLESLWSKPLQYSARAPEDVPV